MYNFTKNKPWYWTVLMVSYTLIGLKYFDMSFSFEFKIIAYILLFTIWLICLFDMLKHNLFNKPFWILSMFILTPICLPSYLWLREKLLR